MKDRFHMLCQKSKSIKGRFMKFLKLFIIIICLFSESAFAQALKEKIHELQPLEINYGVNILTINNKEIIITRGFFQTESAWGGDGYTVAIKEPKHFQMARFKSSKGLNNEVMVWAMPHTGEDSISTIRFFKSKNSEKLYMLKAHKNFKNNITDNELCIFTLYELYKDNDFGIYYFDKIQNQQSTLKYNDTNKAIKSELGIYELN